MKLLSVGHDAKTVKGEKFGYLTGILYLPPADTLKGQNFCPNASPGCRAACLYTAGRGCYPNVQAGRIRKGKLFVSDREAFLSQLWADVELLNLRARLRKMRPVVRLNGTSDLKWEGIAPELFSQFPDVSFMDYTKTPLRMRKFLRGDFPPNYFLTFSRSEKNHRTAMKILHEGGQVAVVFAGKNLPATWKGFPVHDGDRHDVRFTDGAGVIGLASKGKASRDETGFVVDPAFPQGKKIKR